MSMGTTLVTGATGFVGRALMERLDKEGGVRLRAAVRRPDSIVPPSVEPCFVGEIDDSTQWQAAVSGVDVVVHLAARVHVMHETAADPLAEFRRVNVAGTIRLARAAAAAGATRFVYVSSIKVNGEGRVAPSCVYRESDRAVPEDPYGVSKHEAECALRDMTDSGMLVSIVRPPLVYGRGVRANFRALMRLVARGIPLPFAAVNNKRSLVSLPNLVDLILTCARHPAAANQTFFVSDGEDLSTPELVRRLAGVMGTSPRLLPVPPSVLLAAATIAGNRDMARRLVGSLQVDITKARTLLDWNPPLSVDEGLRQTATAFRGETAADASR